METGMPISRFYQHGCSSLLIVMLIGLAREASLGCYQHSLKNRTGPAVELEKIRIGDPDSSLSAADRSRNRTGKNKLNWPVFVKKGWTRRFTENRTVRCRFQKSPSIDLFSCAQAGGRIRKEKKKPSFGGFGRIGSISLDFVHRETLSGSVGFIWCLRVWDLLVIASCWLVATKLWETMNYVARLLLLDVANWHYICSCGLTG